MDLLRIFFSFFSQFSIIQRIAHLRVLMSFTDGSLGDEQLDGFSNVVTNSSGAVIGGSCGTGGFFLMCVLIYFFYKWLNNDTSVHPTNQSGASCPPPPYSHVVRIGECAEPCTFMSKPSTY